jgi:hypothetical protein
MGSKLKNICNNLKQEFLDIVALKNNYDKQGSKANIDKDFFIINRKIIQQKVIKLDDKVRKRDLFIELEEPDIRKKVLKFLEKNQSIEEAIKAMEALDLKFDSDLFGEDDINLVYEVFVERLVTNKTAREGHSLNNKSFEILNTLFLKKLLKDDLVLTINFPLPEEFESDFLTGLHNARIKLKVDASDILFIGSWSSSNLNKGESVRIHCQEVGSNFGFYATGCNFTAEKAGDEAAFGVEESFFFIKEVKGIVGRALDKKSTGYFQTVNNIALNSEGTILVDNVLNYSNKVKNEHIYRYDPVSKTYTGQDYTDDSGFKMRGISHEACCIDNVQTWNLFKNIKKGLLIVDEVVNSLNVDELTEGMEGGILVLRNMNFSKIKELGKGMKGGILIIEDSKLSTLLEDADQKETKVQEVLARLQKLVSKDFKNGIILARFFDENEQEKSRVEVVY